MVVHDARRTDPIGPQTLLIEAKHSGTLRKPVSHVQLLAQIRALDIIQFALPCLEY